MHLKLSFEPLDLGYLKNEKMIEIEGWIQSGCESFFFSEFVIFLFLFYILLLEAQNAFCKKNDKDFKRQTT